MPRPRKAVDINQPLPSGLQRHGRQFRARVPGGAWVKFGDDYARAVAAFIAWRDASSSGATLGAMLDDYVERECRRRVAAGRIKPRTADDYRRDRHVLKKGLGHVLLAQVTPKLIADYRDAREVDAPSHVRNELACLSAALQWAVEQGDILTNPAQSVRRQARKRRMRLISNDEYLDVYAKAIPSVRLAMILAVRTLALPADLLALGPRDLVRTADGARALRFMRGKTGIRVEILLEGDFGALVEAHLAEPVVRQTFISKVRAPGAGKPYTVTGIGAMFRRYCQKAGVKDFALRDLRAKGATDMHRAGVALGDIQLLLGHASVKTTEIYIKELAPGIARPNLTAIVASVKTAPAPIVPSASSAVVAQ